MKVSNNKYRKRRHNFKECYETANFAISLESAYLNDADECKEITTCSCRVQIIQLSQFLK